MYRLPVQDIVNVVVSRHNRRLDPSSESILPAYHPWSLEKSTRLTQV